VLSEARQRRNYNHSFKIHEVQMKKELIPSADVAEELSRPVLAISSIRNWREHHPKAYPIIRLF